jgi:predicted flap endonuclease-1-like 5' DNA nuclease
MPGCRQVSARSLRHRIDLTPRSAAGVLTCIDSGCDLWLGRLKISPMSKHIDEIEGIGAAFSAKLQIAGIKTVEALLEAGATPKGRKELEEKSGIGHHHILKWVNQADLFRIEGVARQYAELLEHAGVDSVRELAERNPEHLYAKLEELNAAHHDVRSLPTAAHVKNWIEQAKSLPRVVQY